jgi:hypothetical protein
MVKSKAEKADKSNKVAKVPKAGTTKGQKKTAATASAKKSKAAATTEKKMRKPRAKKPEGAPKGPMSAYMHFSMEKSPALRQPGKKVGDVAKEVGAMWAGIKNNAAAIKTYVDKANKDKARYLREKEQFDKGEKTFGTTKKAAAKKTTKKAAARAETSASGSGSGSGSGQSSAGGSGNQ